MIAKSIKVKHIICSKRIDGKFYLNNDALLSLTLEDNDDKCLQLSEYAIAFNPPVFKRQFCQNTEKAVQYFQSSDVPAATERSEVFINKKQAQKVNVIVKENQILITGFGTIGNVRLVSKLQHGVAYANNTCRIEVKENNFYGFIYAFLASKYGKAQMNKNASGSVVRYIEAHGIKKTFVPIFTPEKQKQIHDLIIDSTELRVKANLRFEEAIGLFDSKFSVINNNNHIVSNINIKAIINRLDATNVIVSNEISEVYQNSNINSFILVSEVAKDIFIGPRSKRNYTKQGCPFLSGSELQKSNPTKVDKYLNLKDSKPFIVNENCILITRSGTIGNVSIIFQCLNGYAATDDAIRIVLKEGAKISHQYLFAFLNSKIGKKTILSGAFGSVIQHINEDFIGNLLVPIITENEVKIVNECIKEYMSFINTAILKENQAIQLVEKEIEQWQN
ncbi:MAG: hypothetical protein H6Q13_2883 [Bacteroidetes bacterium]|nr:hypothetical protein [Bacteroidota bacterium]